MEAKQFKFKLREIKSVNLDEYVNLCSLVKELEKKKEELRASILACYPDGGKLDGFLISVNKQDRRSFPLDDVKAIVDDLTWARAYEPFIKISTVNRLSVERVDTES